MGDANILTYSNISMKYRLGYAEYSFHLHRYFSYPFYDAYRDENDSGKCRGNVVSDRNSNGDFHHGYYRQSMF